MTVTPDGDVLLVSQATTRSSSSTRGMKSQSVSCLLVGTQLDDSVHATKSRGYFYVVDQKRNLVYSIAAGMRASARRPVITGFGSPTGLTFVPRT